MEDGEELEFFIVIVFLKGGERERERERTFMGYTNVSSSNLSGG
jgi:hypothetical protein